MQALKSLFRRPAPATKIVTTPRPVDKPTLLTPAELKAVAGGIPRIGGFAVETAATKVSLD